MAEDALPELASLLGGGICIDRADPRVLISAELPKWPPLKLPEGEPCWRARAVT